MTWSTFKIKTQYWLSGTTCRNRRRCDDVPKSPKEPWEAFQASWKTLPGNFLIKRMTGDLRGLMQF